MSTLTMAKSTTMARPPRLLRHGKGNVDTPTSPAMTRVTPHPPWPRKKPTKALHCPPHLVGAPPPLFCPHHRGQSHREYQELLQHAHHGHRSTVELTCFSN